MHQACGKNESEADSALHLADSGVVASDLLLDLGLVLFEVREALLKVEVFLALVGNGLVVDLAHVLEAGNQVRHVVAVEGVELMPHRLDLHTVGFNLALVVFELLLSLTQQRAQMLNIEADRVGVGTGGAF